MPGPIVVATATDLRYVPFAAAGLAFTIASIIAVAFSSNLSLPNDFLPKPAQKQKLSNIDLIVKKGLTQNVSSFLILT